MPRPTRMELANKSAEWNTGEDDADASRDPLYKKLTAQLEHLTDNTFAVRMLHSWLSGVRLERQMRDIAARIVDTKRRAEQKRACDVLERAARLISQRFTALSKEIPFDQGLYLAYRSMPRPDGRLEPPQAWQAGSDWGEFLERVRTDTAHVARIASAARAAFAQNPGKPGRTRKTQRDAQFEELLIRLSKIVTMSAAKQRSLAIDVLAIYFGHDEIADDGVARGLLQRGRQRRAQEGN